MSCVGSFGERFATGTSSVATNLFHKIVHTLVAEMGEAYPELRDSEDQLSPL